MASSTACLLSSFLSLSASERASVLNTPMRVGHAFASLWDMILSRVSVDRTYTYLTHRLMALATRHSHAALVHAPEELLLGVVDHCGIVASWTSLESVNASFRQLGILLEAMIEVKRFIGEQSSELRFGKECRTARAIHASDALEVNLRTSNTLTVFCSPNLVSACILTHSRQNKCPSLH